MKRMFLDIEEAWIDRKLANLKKKELPRADEWKVAQF